MLADDVIAQVRERMPRWAASLAEASVALTPPRGDFNLDNPLIAENGAIVGPLDREAARLGDPLRALRAPPSTTRPPNTTASSPRSADISL